MVQRLDSAIQLIDNYLNAYLCLFSFIYIDLFVHLFIYGVYGSYKSKISRTIAFFLKYIFPSCKICFRERVHNTDSNEPCSKGQVIEDDLHVMQAYLNGVAIGIG